MTDDEHDDGNYAMTIAGLGAAAAEPQIILAEHRPLLVLSKQVDFHDIEDRLPAPSRIRERRIFCCVQSLIDYVNKYGYGDTLVLADVDGRSIVCTLDYHGPGEPRWGDHVCKLQARHSDEWTAWIEANERWMDQRAFAEHIEDNLLDVYDPPASELLDLIKTIRVVRNGSYASTIDMTGAGASVQLASDVRAKAGAASLDIPSSITLRLPVFDESEPIDVIARIRVRPDDGNLKLGYRLLHPRRIVRDEFLKIVAAFEDGCDLGLITYRV